MHALMLAVDYCSFSVTENRVLHTVMCMPTLATMSDRRLAIAAGDTSMSPILRTLSTMVVHLPHKEPAVSSSLAVSTII